MKIRFDQAIVNKHEQQLFTYEGQKPVLMNQKHSSAIFVHRKGIVYEEPHDGLISFSSGLFGIYTADCVPLVIAFQGGAVMLHAGWKGLAARIVANAFSFLERHAGIKKQDCMVHVFPHISSQAYLAVKPENGGDQRAAIMQEQFGPLAVRTDEQGNQYLDQTYCVWQECQGAQVDLSANRCTYSSPDLPSYFRDKDGRRLLTLVHLEL